MARYRSGEREQFWREVIADQAACGLSIQAFCREREVSQASFFKWRRKLADCELAGDREVSSAAPEAAAEFVEIDLSQAADSAGLAKSSGSPVRSLAAGRSIGAETLVAGPVAAAAGCEIVLPNECRVIVPVLCDVSWLREMLAAVRETSC